MRSPFLRGPRRALLGRTQVVSGTTLGVVAASRGQLPTAILAVTQNSTSRRTHWASTQGDITNLKCRDVNWYLANTFTPTGGGATISFKRYIEYPVNVFHQVLWSASGTLTMVTGSAIYTSDVILSSITGLPLVIPAGAKFWERTVKTSAASQNIPVIELPVSSQTLGIDDGNTAGSDLGNSGTINPTSTVNTWGSLFISGDIAKANAKSFVIIGDSIVWGTGDISSADSKFNTGWLARSIGPTYPYFKIGKGSWSASDFAASAVAWTNLFGALSVSDAVFELGVNDLRLGRTTVQLLGDQQTDYAKVTATRKWQTTITPRSDSTDSWATTVNQTAKTDGTMTSLNDVNAAIRAVPAGLTGIIEAADLAMSARDSGIWGGPFPPTTDGTHPNTSKATSVAAGYVP